MQRRTARPRTPKTLSTVTVTPAPCDGAPRLRTTFRKGELRNKICSLWRPSTTNLQCQNHQGQPIRGKSAPCPFLPLTTPLRLVSRLLAWGFYHLVVLTTVWCRLQIGRLPRVAVRLQPFPDVQHRLPQALPSSRCGPRYSATHGRQLQCKFAQPCFRVGTPFFPTPLSARKLQGWPKSVWPKSVTTKVKVKR